MNLLLFFFLFSAYQEPWGQDIELLHPPKNEIVERPSFATYLANTLIRFHQQVISPANGSRSHFRPSSSRYMQLAMQRYGFLKGFIMGCDRLLRENDEMWVYQTVEVNGRIFKYDPALLNKK